MANEQQQPAKQPAPQRPAIENPFSPEPPARAPQHTVNPSLHVRRTGLIPLCIGASRMVSLPDGKRQFEARELRVEAARAQYDQRTLHVACICFECRKMYESYDALSADHPSTQQMFENGESHTWAYWCTDKYDPKSLENIEALKAKIKALKHAQRLAIDGLAKVTDIEVLMKEQTRADEIGKMIDVESAKLKREQDNIIGLLSETPFAS